jgi:hypothetical protein
MPGRNIVKYYVPQTFYHLYNRGIDRQVIFHDQADYIHFEWLLERTLSPDLSKDAKGREYTRLHGEVELNAYCLLSNHFHLLCYQEGVEGIVRLMRSVLTAYTMYYNKKYHRRGPLFENSYRAVEIIRDDQLQHITRYIHLNHREFRTWPHSSFHDYLSTTRAWILPKRILELFDDVPQYKEFVLDYEENQHELDKLKAELAGFDDY